MNVLTNEKRCRVVAALVEGNSIRATVRMTGVAKNTVVKLLVDLGEACATYQDKVFRDLPCKRIQCDEIWSFCYAKQKNLPPDKQGEYGYGDVFTWVAIDADTKLVPYWLVGWRDALHAMFFMKNVAGRLNSRVQLTTDGHTAYLQAVDRAFDGDVDYAMLRKVYGRPESVRTSEARYSPPKCIAQDVIAICGKPDQKHASTSFVERQNLTMRMGMRRFTRLTNGFSKKFQNLEAAVALHFMHYNFCRVHRTLKTTPAVSSGVANHVWEVGEIVGLLKVDAVDGGLAKKTA